MSNFFTRLLEAIWLLVGIIAAVAAVNGFKRSDTQNGLVMALVSLIGFLMFLARRNLRLRGKNTNK
jgi:hypothetical protein